MGLTQSEKPLKEAFKAIRDTGPCSLWSRSHQNIFRSWEISSANDHLSSEEQPQTTPKLGSTVTVALWVPAQSAQLIPAQTPYPQKLGSLIKMFGNKMYAM